MTRILVTGASGLLGANLALQLHAAHEITGVTHAHDLREPPFPVVMADLSVPGAGARLVDEMAPELVIHCAAMANLDACESQPGLALRVNGELPGEMAGACRRLGARFIQLSTDAVFDGKRGGYIETDAPGPLNVYARTKLAGERSVTAANPEALIARVNFYGWSPSGTRSLGELFYTSLASGKGMMGFTDVFFCPLQVNDLVDTLLEMDVKRLSGLFHTVSAESISKYDFGRAIARRFGFNEELIRPVSWREAGLKAARSPDLTLSTGKLSSALGHALPGQAAGLERFYTTFEARLPEKLRALLAVPADRVQNKEAL